MRIRKKGDLPKVEISLEKLGGLEEKNLQEMIERVESAVDADAVNLKKKAIKLKQSNNVSQFIAGVEADGKPKNKSLDISLGKVGKVSGLKDLFEFDEGFEMKEGASVKVRWQGKWEKALIRKINGDICEVYIGLEDDKIPELKKLPVAQIIEWNRKV
ncbi:MAG: hypothetical protein ABIJ23_04030 [Candidatus Magasanikbacteria bacterium]